MELSSNSELLMPDTEYEFMSILEELFKFQAEIYGLISKNSGFFQLITCTDPAFVHKPVCLFLPTVLSCSRSGGFYCHLLPVPLEENSFFLDICVTQTTGKGQTKVLSTDVQAFEKTHKNKVNI